MVADNVRNFFLPASGMEQPSVYHKAPENFIEIEGSWILCRAKVHLLLVSTMMNICMFSVRVSSESAYRSIALM